MIKEILTLARQRRDYAIKRIFLEKRKKYRTLYAEMGRPWTSGIMIEKY